MARYFYFFPPSPFLACSSFGFDPSTQALQPLVNHPFMHEAINGHSQAPPPAGVSNVQGAPEIPNDPGNRSGSVNQVGPGK